MLRCELIWRIINKKPASFVFSSLRLSVRKQKAKMASQFLEPENALFSDAVRELQKTSEETTVQLSGGQKAYSVLTVDKDRLTRESIISTLKLDFSQSLRGWTIVGKDKLKQMRGLLDPKKPMLVVVYNETPAVPYTGLLSTDESRALLFQYIFVMHQIYAITGKFFASGAQVIIVSRKQTSKFSYSIGRKDGRFDNFEEPKDMKYELQFVYANMKGNDTPDLNYNSICNKLFPTSMSITDETLTTLVQHLRAGKWEANSNVPWGPCMLLFHRAFATFYLGTVNTAPANAYKAVDYRPITTASTTWPKPTFDYKNTIDGPVKTLLDVVKQKMQAAAGANPTYYIQVVMAENGEWLSSIIEQLNASAIFKDKNIQFVARPINSVDGTIAEVAKDQPCVILASKFGERYALRNQRETFVQLNTYLKSCKYSASLSNVIELNIFVTLDASVNAPLAEGYPEKSAIVWSKFVTPATAVNLTKDADFKTKNEATTTGGLPKLLGLVENRIPEVQKENILQSSEPSANVALPTTDITDARTFKALIELYADPTRFNARGTLFDAWTKLYNDNTKNNNNPKIENGPTISPFMQDGELILPDNADSLRLTAVDGTTISPMKVQFNCAVMIDILLAVQAQKMEGLTLTSADAPDADTFNKYVEIAALLDNTTPSDQVALQSLGWFFRPEIIMAKVIKVTNKGGKTEDELKTAKIAARCKAFYGTMKTTAINLIAVYDNDLKAEKASVDIAAEKVKTAYELLRSWYGTKNPLFESANVRIENAYEKYVTDSKLYTSALDFVFFDGTAAAPDYTFSSNRIKNAAYIVLELIACAALPKAEDSARPDPVALNGYIADPKVQTKVPEQLVRIAFLDGKFDPTNAVARQTARLEKDKLRVEDEILVAAFAVVTKHTTSIEPIRENLTKCNVVVGEANDFITDNNMNSARNQTASAVSLLESATKEYAALSLAVAATKTTLDNVTKSTEKKKGVMLKITELEVAVAKLKVELDATEAAVKEVVAKTGGKTRDEWLALFREDMKTLIGIYNLQNIGLKATNYDANHKNELSRIFHKMQINIKTAIPGMEQTTIRSLLLQGRINMDFADTPETGTGFELHLFMRLYTRPKFTSIYTTVAHELSNVAYIILECLAWLCGCVPTSDALKTKVLAEMEQLKGDDDDHILTAIPTPICNQRVVQIATQAGISRPIDPATALANNADLLRSAIDTVYKKHSNVLTPDEIIYISPGDYTFYAAADVLLTMAKYFYAKFKSTDQTDIEPMIKYDQTGPRGGDDDITSFLGYTLLQVTDKSVTQVYLENTNMTVRSVELLYVLARSLDPEWALTSVKKEDQLAGIVAQKDAKPDDFKLVRTKLKATALTLNAKISNRLDGGAITDSKEEYDAKVTAKRQEAAQKKAEKEAAAKRLEEEQAAAEAERVKKAKERTDMLKALATSVGIKVPFVAVDDQAYWEAYEAAVAKAKKSQVTSITNVGNIPLSWFDEAADPLTKKRLQAAIFASTNPTDKAALRKALAISLINV